MGFLKDGKHVVAACSDGQLRLIDPVEGKCLQWSVAHAKKMNTMVLSRSGRMLVTGSDDCLIKAWTLKNL